LWSEKSLGGSRGGDKWGTTKTRVLKEEKEDSQDGMVWDTFLGETEGVFRISVRRRVGRES